MEPDTRQTSDHFKSGVRRSLHGQAYFKGVTPCLFQVRFAIFSRFAMLFMPYAQVLLKPKSQTNSHSIILYLLNDYFYYSNRIRSRTRHHLPGSSQGQGHCLFPKVPGY